MLQRSPSYTPTGPAGQRQPRCHPVLTGQVVAKNHLTPRARARQAAGWILGLISLQRPTVPHGAAVFHVCEELIRQELRNLRASAGSAPTTVLEAGWLASTAFERDRFVRGRLAELWDEIDRITR
jgi:hypothetical protein